MVARQKKVPLRTIPQYFSLAQKRKVGRLILYVVPTTTRRVRFSCIISSQKQSFTAVERNRIKRLLYRGIEDLLTMKLVYNLDIVCVAFCAPTVQELQSIRHEISLLAVSPTPSIQA